MKSLLKTLILVPFTLELFLLCLAFQQMSPYGLAIHIIILFLLGIISYGILSNKKLMNKIGFLALIILTILLCIMGYYDYLKWFSTIVGIVIFIYYIVINIILRKLK